MTTRGGAPASPLASVNGSSTLDAALLYASTGWPVFPVNGKRPHTANGLHDATTNLEQLREWWKRWPEANVAVATGTASGLVVVDGDGAEGVAAAEALLGEDALLTLQAETGSGGRHWFFQHPGHGKVPNSAGRLAPRVDVRGDGGFVVLPPSLHPSGGRYRLLNPDGELPSWRFGTAEDSTTTDSVELGDLKPVENEDPTAVAKRAELLERLCSAPEGQRNETLFQVSADLGYLARAGGLDPERTAKALAATARSIGLEPREIPGTVRSGLVHGASQAPPSGESVGIADVLDRVEGLYRRFLVFGNDHAPVALTLWVAHTHCFSAARYTPYPKVWSPEPESGKTRVIEVSELVVARPWTVTDPSPATLYRKVEKVRPTLMLDEYESVFAKKEAEEGLKSMFNVGFRRGAVVPRCIGQGTAMDVKDFSVWCPKMLVGLGRTTDAVESRSIPIRMQRRRADEPVEDFDEEVEEASAAKLRAELAAWAEAHTERLKGMRPQAPPVLTDRQRDVWRPLLAIADAAGEEWPDKARKAAAALHSKTERDETDTALLLGIIRDVFGKRDKLLTEELLRGIVEQEEGPWPAWWARDLENGNVQGPASRLASALRHYHASDGGAIRPKDVKVDKVTRKGYYRSQFEDVWERYL